MKSQPRLSAILPPKQREGGMQEFGSAWDWLPKSLVDWAQIFSAIGTCGAVIVSLWIALRRSKPELRISASVVMLIGDPRVGIGPDPEFLNISIVNAAPNPVTITAIGWQVKRRWRPGVQPGYAHQFFADRRFPVNPTLPLHLEQSQGSDLYLALDGEDDWRAAIAESNFFAPRLQSRRALRRLRIAVGTSVGVTCWGKPNDAVLELIWSELQKAREGEAPSR